MLRYFAHSLTRTPTHSILPQSVRKMSLNAMAQRLSRKTVLITGASAGIGRATALEFSRSSPDIHLILTARRIDALKEVAQQLESESQGNTKVLPVKFDISNQDEVRTFLDKLPEEWRAIDVLVNNACVD